MDDKKAKKIQATDHEDNVNVVYYDGGCPICNREISSIKNRLDIYSGSNIHFVNVHSESNLPECKQDMLKNLHVYTESGEKIIGLDANIYMWRLSGWWFFSALISNNLCRPIAGYFYNVWSKKRYKDLYG